jgi:Leucine rich repeat
VQLTPPEKSQAFWGVVSAAFAHHDVQLGLEIKATRPPLHAIELLRDVNGTISTSLGISIWRALSLQHVTRLRCNEGIGSLWDRSLLDKFSSLRVLNLSHANLTTLPGVIGTLTSLQELRLVGNQLKILPSEIGKLENLRVLAVDSNELSLLPGELRKCAALEEFTLENNRLTSVLLSFGSLRKLRTLHISSNPLEFLPEIAPCQELRSLSVANLRVSADQEFNVFNVELQAVTGPGSSININLFDSKPTDKLRPIFSLMLRRSSGHHPLLAGAFRKYFIIFLYFVSPPSLFV